MTAGGGALERVAPLGLERPRPRQDVGEVGRVGD